MSTLIATERRVDAGAWIRYGILGGILAGIVFALFEMIVAAVLDGTEAFFMPLRMIGGMGLGPAAMDPGTSLLTAGGVGLAIHMALSMVYGVAITAVLGLVPQLSATRTAVLASTSLAGFGLWVANFYVFAPIFGWTWFPNETNPFVQIVAHTVFFGTALGLILDEAYFRRSRSSAVSPP
jgi:hypothetical protein